MGHFVCVDPPLYLIYPPFNEALWAADFGKRSLPTQTSALYNDSITILPTLLKRESTYGNERGESSPLTILLSATVSPDSESVGLRPDF